jgi:hypothetical protein
MTNYIITLYNQKKFILISAENCLVTNFNCIRKHWREIRKH